ncbi:MAG: hypothetical protein Q4B94_05100 [Pseudomonadota bacterium]|nr:hypothetical protein [Pseudomonadota bacterium]
MTQEGLSACEALALFNIRGGTCVISGWQRQCHAQGLAGLQSKLRGKVKKMSISPSPKPVNAVPDAQCSREALLEEVKYLRAEVAYLKNCRPCVRPRHRLHRKAQVVHELRQGHALAHLLKAAALSRSTLYYRVKAQQGEDKQALKARIQSL